jgi:hypothetical protein
MKEKIEQFRKSLQNDKESLVQNKFYEGGQVVSNILIRYNELFPQEQYPNVPIEITMDAEGVTGTISPPLVNTDIDWVEEADSTFPEYPKDLIKEWEDYRNGYGDPWRREYPTIPDFIKFKEAAGKDYSNISFKEWNNQSVKDIKTIREDSDDKAWKQWQLEHPNESYPDGVPDETTESLMHDKVQNNGGITEEE